MKVTKRGNSWQYDFRFEGKRYRKRHLRLKEMLRKQQISY